MRYFVATKPFLSSPFRYFTMLNNIGCSRVISFSNREHANSFREYVILHKHKYNTWPIIDASDNKTYSVKTDSLFPKHVIEKHVHIIGWNEEDVQDVCSTVNVINATYFDYNETNNTMSLRVFDEGIDCRDISKFRLKLEHYL